MNPCRNDDVVQWLAPSPHSEKVPDPFLASLFCNYCFGAFISFILFQLSFPNS